MKKAIAIGILVVLIVGGLFFFFRYYWPFADGVKAGTLDQIMHKGYVFKTYEGSIHQDKLVNATDKVWEFSVEDERIADSLTRCAGAKVTLHYKEYKNPLPWRGMQRFIVDSIVTVGR
ncbi:MAG: hypothetical protein II937_07275 [Bacteroidales bacterium]|nr:hypothetical protein [Bacteroidales bacterium]